MGKNDTIRYYAEGECEKKLIEVLKSDFRMIKPGKVEVFNPLTRRLTSARLMLIPPNTTVVLVFDTDFGKTEVFDDNIKILTQSTRVKRVIMVLQVKNLEDELIRSCKIKKISQLLNCKSDKDFKSDFINASDLKSTLLKNGFNFENLWNQHDRESFPDIRNEAVYIRL